MISYKMKIVIGVIVVGVVSVSLLWYYGKIDLPFICPRGETSIDGECKVAEPSEIVDDPLIETKPDGDGGVVDVAQPSSSSRKGLSTPATTGVVLLVLLIVSVVIYAIFGRKSNRTEEGVAPPPLTIEWFKTGTASNLEWLKSTADWLTRGTKSNLDRFQQHVSWLKKRSADITRPDSSL